MSFLQSQKGCLMAQLVFSQHQNPLFQVRLHASEMSIGRSEDCDVVLREPYISRRHAIIFHREGQFLLKKQGKGSIKVNGEEIEASPLKDQDKIEMGIWLAHFQSAQSSQASEETQFSKHGLENTQALSQSPENRNALQEEDFHLQIIQPQQKMRQITLRPGLFYLGADSNNDFVLQDPYVSSRHVCLNYDSGKIWVRDLESTNGTYLGGVRIREALWRVGEVLRIGQCQCQLLSHSPSLKKEDSAPDSHYFGELFGRSPIMKKLYSELSKVAQTEATTLLLGESGSGKELAARAIHQHSSRSPQPFVAINCGAISRELIESELFGHEKGAFTGAGRSHEGAFGQAKGGTLFLDEIGELPLELQPKLLRVLENKTYRRVGGAQELRADVRVVAATHRDLSQWVEQKKFREDLFFRLFVLPIQLPSLRERREDIPELAQIFLREFSMGGKTKTISEEVIELLKSHSYPGNVRELRNILMRAVVLSQGEEIQPKDILFPHCLKPSTSQSAELVSVSNPWERIEKLTDMEREMICRALKQASGNKAQAARNLGIAKSTLFAKIKLYAIDVESLRAS